MWFHDDNMHNLNKIYGIDKKILLFKKIYSNVYYMYILGQVRLWGSNLNVKISYVIVYAQVIECLLKILLHNGH
jgi:hypothetical protein